MEKILLVINANQPDLTSIDFALQLSVIAQTKLTGLFIENVFSDYEPVTGEDETSYFKTFKENTAFSVTADTELAIRLFKEECTKKNVEFEVHVDKGEPIQEVIFESRFADLIMIDPDIKFYKNESQLPSHFVKEVLASAECPVLLIPDHFEAIDEIVFCYDGSASSVFAIKQFTYLFPEMKSYKVKLLQVTEKEVHDPEESLKRMQDWMHDHYTTVTYHSLDGFVKDELFNYFFMKKDKFIVMGAYGRSTLSNFFYKSSADVLIRSVDLPLFITHY